MTNPVYVAPSARKFHARTDCHRLRVGKSFTQVDLDQVPRCTPCQICVPGAPKVKFLKRFCTECNSVQVRPCAHNGGVLVEYPITTTYYSALRVPGDTYMRRAYVWPDRAHLYTQV